MASLTDASGSVAAAHSARAETQPLALSSAFRRYAPYVARIGLRILGRPDEVDDLVQDVFLSAHKHLPALRDPAALKGWLASIAVRAAHRRLKRRRLQRLFGFDANEPDYAGVADGKASLEDQALISALFEALDSVPASERVAWSLRHLEGETMERVAELCTCSLSTAKRRVQAAENALVKKGVLHE
jgi:RNA polymerase sigma-70 factor (ECF subfamily)